MTWCRAWALVEAQAQLRYDASKGASLETFAYATARGHMLNSVNRRLAANMPLADAGARDEASEAPNPEECYLREEGRALALEWLDAAPLTEKQRAVVTAVFLEGQRPTALARNLGVESQTVFLHIRNALATLRAHATKRDATESACGELSRGGTTASGRHNGHTD